jgi:DNA-binding transcriptional regulator LsrR (DeoR family)
MGGKMRRKVDEIELLAAAYLYGKQQQTQDAIGRTLGLSQSVVSRLIAQAKARGYLETKVAFVDDHLDESMKRRIQERIRPTRLQEILLRISALSGEYTGPVLHVYPSNSKVTTAAAWRHRIDEFSTACASDLLDVLGRASVIGVSWGDMVANTIDAIRKAANERLAGKRGVRTIPLLGEPLGRNITRHSSSVLAAQLEEVLNPYMETGREHGLSLAPVPALIPSDMSEPEINAIRKLIGRIAAYREIFGNGERDSSDESSLPWIDRIDAVLTSVSTQERSLSFFDDSLIRAAGVSREKLNELVIGDLCGALIPRSNLNDKARAEVDDIIRRWTGVTISQLQSCAARSKSGAPGVIVVAIGANKAPVVYAAIRSGLVQHLFTDQDLADGLEQICSTSDAVR